MLTRMEMKQRAKDAMKNASTHPVLVFLVYLVITLAMTGIINFITQSVLVGISLGTSMVDSVATNIGAALTMIPLSLIFSLIPFAITSILLTGLTAFYLKTIRHQQAGMETLFAFFKSAVKIFCLYFMVQLFIVLWSMLFFIPGIIATYRYSMAVYIYIDDPDKGVMQCITESKMMMIGHKWEFFVLQISFILWWLLCVVTCGLASLYVAPYGSLTSAVYYDNLKFITTPQPVNSNPDQQWSQTPDMNQQQM